MPWKKIPKMMCAEKLNNTSNKTKKKMNALKDLLTLNEHTFNERLDIFILEL